MATKKKTMPDVEQEVVETAPDTAPEIEVTPKEIAPEEEVKELELVPQKAKWLDKGDAKECENCGAQLHGWAVRAQFRFCPFCGTEMQVI